MESVLGVRPAKISFQRRFDPDHPLHITRQHGASSNRWQEAEEEVVQGQGQGQGQPRCGARQEHGREAPEGCPVIPPHHSRCPRRQTEDQWLASTQGPQRPRGEGRH